MGEGNAGQQSQLTHRQQWTGASCATPSPAASTSKQLELPAPSCPPRTACARIASRGITFSGRPRMRTGVHVLHILVSVCACSARTTVLVQGP